MIKPLLIALAGLTVAGLAQAQAPAGPAAPPPPRARGPSAALSVEAVQAAVAACLATGDKVSAVVLDSAGVQVVMLTADGGNDRSQATALSKAWTTLTYKVPSSEITIKARTDTALAAELKANPKIGQARPGGLPIMVGPDMIGAMAVAGAKPGGDEPCTKVGLAKIGSRLN